MSNFENLYSELKKKYKNKISTMNHYKGDDLLNVKPYSKFCISHNEVAVFIENIDNTNTCEIWVQNDEEGEGATIANKATIEQVDAFIELIMVMK